MKSHRDNTQPIAPHVVRVTTFLAIFISALVAVMPPVLNLYYGVQITKGHETADAELRAHLVTQLVGKNPKLWEFETLRLEEIIAADLHHGEKKVVLNARGDIVALAGNETIANPVVTVVSPIYDSGEFAGEVAITKSLAEPVQSSLFIFLISTILSLLVFLALKSAPLRFLRKAIDRATFLASHDPLTTLPNRALFNEWLVHSAGDADRQDASMAVLCLNLDHFKDVNDTLGHAAGDNLLRQVSESMNRSLSGNELLARIGGDEFAVIQTHFDGPDETRRLAEHLIAELSKPFDVQGNEVLIGASVGIAMRDGREDRDGQTLLRQAGQAVYKAKSDGRGKVRYFKDEMNDQLVARNRMKADLRQALSRNELQLLYQPQIDLKTYKIKGVEALLRWNHGEHGLVSPDKFIPLAEETGLIIPIGAWVIMEACRQAKDWPQLSFAVNVSPVQFGQGDLVETVQIALRDQGVEPHRLELEITEGALLSNTEETIATLTALQNMGVKIAMDDFGTGYSSMSYLCRFRFDKIKIDKSFTAELGKSKDAQSIVEAVINLGSSMGMTSNAEGVETFEQAELLRNYGCNEVQGFLFGKPLLSVSIAELLSRWEGSKHRNPTESNLKRAI